jgi:Sec-independent protein translocase protein TatA
MKYLLKISVVVMLLLSCKGSADKKAPELANDMCGCFDGFQSNLSEDAKKLMKEVSTAAKPQEVLMAGMTKLKPKVAKVFAEQLKTLGDKNSTVFKCMQEFDKKHAKETTTDKDALTEKLLMEMQRKGNCYVGAAIVNLNPIQK